MLNANTQQMDGKNLVLIYTGDTSGCSHVRLRYNAAWYCGHEHLGFVPVLLPFPTFDPAYLARAKAIIIQRPVSPGHVDLVKRYKALQPKFGYKLVSEFDDQVWEIDGQGIPEYNTASLHFDIKGTTAVCEQTLPLFDELIVSTEYLKRKLLERFPVKNVTVIPNVVPRFLWSYPRKQNITEDLVKPTVLYSGSPCHYRNPVPARKPSPQEPQGFPGITALKGDMDNAWCDWVIKNVKEDKSNTEMEDIEVSTKDIWDNVQVDVCAKFPKVKMSLGELREMAEGVVMELDSVYGNEVVLEVENKNVAKGELVIVGYKYGVKITEIYSQTEDVTAEDAQPHENAGNNEDFDVNDFDIKE